MIIGRPIHRNRIFECDYTANEESALIIQYSESSVREL